MLARIFSAATIGLEAVPIEVEVNIEATGFPRFSIVGLPDKAIEEAKERVRSAMKNSGFDFPARRITVNLAPADLPKQGPAYDLPIALGILLASEQMPNRSDKPDSFLSDSLFLGELSLDGSLRSTPGVLPLAFLAKEKGLQSVFLPKQNAAEASLIQGFDVFGLENLAQLFEHLIDKEILSPEPQRSVSEFLENVPCELDFADILGQENAKRALEIAAAGGHNILMKGPPGAGKTLLAKAFASILPKLTIDEALEVSRIYSIIGGLSSQNPLIKHRPFRSPHHTTSRIGLVGGGSYPRPGEISLAHRGVLFLDEFPEFSRSVLETLRQPIEDGVVTISRAAGSLTFPAKFILVGAMNPCPCGFLGDEKRRCTCRQSQIFYYQKRISGPILDRIDLHIEVPKIETEKLIGKKSIEGESSEIVKQRVENARQIQSARFKDKRIICNGEMSSRDVKELCKLDDQCLDFLRQAVNKLGLSGRSYHKVLKLGRTIADLAGDNQLSVNHLAEALQYRPKIEMGW